MTERGIKRLRWTTHSRDNSLGRGHFLEQQPGRATRYARLGGDRLKRAKKSRGWYETQYHRLGLLIDVLGRLAPGGFGKGGIKVKVKE